MRQDSIDVAPVEKRFVVALPEELLAGFGWPESEVSERVRETLVMDLLRLDRLSDAQAGAILGLSRWELLDTMGRYQVPAIRMGLEELQRELAKEVRRTAWIGPHLGSVPFPEIWEVPVGRYLGGLFIRR